MREGSFSEITRSLLKEFVRIDGRIGTSVVVKFQRIIKGRNERKQWRAIINYVLNEGHYK